MNNLASINLITGSVRFVSHSTANVLAVDYCNGVGSGFIKGGKSI